MKQVVVTLAVLSLMCPLLHSQWLPQGILLSEQAQNQLGTVKSISADGNGGSYVVWFGIGKNSGSGIYMQRVSSEGYKLWGPSVVFHTDGILSSTFRARCTFSKMSSAVAVQINGLLS